MNNAENVYLLVLSGELAAAQQFLGEHYPGYPVVQLSKRDLRESGLRARVGRLRTLKGKAVVIFSNSVDTVR